MVVIFPLEVSRPVSGGLLRVIGAARQLGPELFIRLLLAAVPDAMLDAELLVHALDRDAILVQHFAPSDDVLGQILRVMNCTVGRLPEANVLLGGFCRVFFSQF